MLRSLAVFGSSLLVAVHGNIVLFPWTGNDGTFGNAVDATSGFGNSKPISTQCAAALNQTVACDPQMQLLAASGYVVNIDSSSAGLCNSKCNSSLVAYRAAVTSACGASGAFDDYPNTWRGDIIYDYFNTVCDKDPGSGEYCPKWLKEQYAANGNPKQEDLPISVLCSHCQLNNMRTVQSSIFLGYNDALVDTYNKIFTKCGAGAAATPKPPPQDTFPNTADGTNRTCLSGKTYNSKPGDSCHSIALAQGVAEDTLASINDLGADCGRLTLESNFTTFDLCLPQTCETMQTGASDDCWSLSSEYNITFAQFVAYNPTINGACSNLRPNGTVVCVSSPDGSYNPVALPGSNSSWAQGEYADDVVPAPGNVAFNTTANCGAYYQVQTADNCNRISLAAKVSVSLFLQINPSIDAECDNLIPGLWYCVHPTYDWSDTDDDNDDGSGTPTSTVVSAPAPTPTGTTSQCFKWHTVVKDDNCALLQNTLGVTMAQLTAWNPDLKADCSNLILGDAYCVQGASSSSSPSTSGSKPTTTTTARTSFTAKPVTVSTTATTTHSLTTLTTKTTPSTPPASSTTGGPSSPVCAQTYTVAQGDNCYTIWTKYSLTEAAFRALNPSLNANCDLTPAQVLCVKSGSGGGGGTTAVPSSTPTPTAGSGSGSCKKSYTVVIGDTCSKIWGRFGLSEAQFRGLNQGLNAACDLREGQVVCVG